MKKKGNKKANCKSKLTTSFRCSPILCDCRLCRIKIVIHSIQRRESNVIDSHYIVDSVWRKIDSNRFSHDWWLRWSGRQMPYDSGCSINMPVVLRQLTRSPAVIIVVVVVEICPVRRRRCVTSSRGPSAAGADRRVVGRMISLPGGCWRQQRRLHIDFTEVFPRDAAQVMLTEIN